MRIRTILAAAAAPAALAAVLLGTAASASAATVNNPSANPGNGALVIKTQAQADALSGTTIDKNVSVPAGVTKPNGDPVFLGGVHITGNLSVQGDLMLGGDTVDGNVTVSGPGSFLGLTNGSSHFGRDLIVTGSSGIYQGGPGTMSFGNWTQWADKTADGRAQVDGSFMFINNTGGLRSQMANFPVHVSGNFTAYGNGPYPRPDAPQYNWDTNGLQVDGSTSVVPPTYSS